LVRITLACQNALIIPVNVELKRAKPVAEVAADPALLEATP
jgi:hypothetical protein